MAKTQGYEIIGTGIYVRTAWEATDGPFGSSHSTIKTIDGVWMGQIGTRRPPASVFENAKTLDERCNAVMAFYRNQYAEAYIAIGHNCPKARKDMGEVSCPCPTVRIPASLAEVRG